MGHDRDAIVLHVGDHLEGASTSEIDGSNSNNKSQSCANSADYAIGRVDSLKFHSTILGPLQRLEKWVQGGNSSSTDGPERVPEDQRSNPPAWTMITLWISMTMNPSNIILGMYGPMFGLSVYDSILVGVLGTFFGAMGPAFAATLAPLTGLRQIAITRFSLGIWGGRVCAILKVIIIGGYAIVQTILSGQTIAAISGRYSWALIFVLVCVLLGQSAQDFSPTPGDRQVHGPTYIGSCLSFFSIAFGGAITWTTMAGDYYVQYRADTSKVKVFILTFAGLFASSTFLIVTGAYLGGTYASDPAFATAYDESSIGGVVLYSMTPRAWGQVTGVLFAVSFTAVQSAMFYSMSLSLQQLHRFVMQIPRLLWTTLISGTILGIALGGQNAVADIISNFVALLGYFGIILTGCMALEHFVFRPRLGGYDADKWQDQTVMPWGVAGLTTLLAGYGLTFLGMNQTWFVGPLAKLIGDGGGDVGPFIALLSCLIIFAPVRTLEIKYLGR
ncbi:hypothetical protein BO99DRAFT_426834 [Aspergillus violaceofuscus CBS 115571]|uniref:Uncharacterized protein n=1 Tax=Aspergillus violaceofuscus (strain CBS 115571) TaxID=1450538 RepID=A0A2V5GRW4_ASPV1|nr:hypothetical protein BO99DRAFT_426834 [Aspergillus violaceofuscus CBS 115571]